MAGDSLSTWATVVLMIPFGILLAMAVFGLDTRLATPRAGRSSRVRFCEVDANGEADLADPDGRIWRRNGPERDATARSDAGRASGSIEGLGLHAG